MRKLDELIAGLIPSGPVSLQQEPMEEPGFFPAAAVTREASAGQLLFPKLVPF